MSKPKKIALVEDDENLRELVQDLLLSLGYAVATFPNGQEFLSRYQRGQYDAIIMDTHMPDPKGYEVCADIRKQKQDQEVVIIGMSAQECRSEWGNAGATDYISKPFPIETLERTLLRYFTSLK